MQNSFCSDLENIISPLNEVVIEIAELFLPTFH